MGIFNDSFANKPLRLLNHTNIKTIFDQPYNALASFAIEDAMATVVGENLAPTTIRLWTHTPTLVLGIPDSRLENLASGLHFIKQLGYDVIVRNSGGLAVLLDENVLNISFVLPNKRHLSINEGYDLMYDFTRQLFAKEEATILAYEIVGSYCPGDYDLSIDGKKFAGISQRRVRNGVAIQMYLDIAGISSERASIVKHFYELAKGKNDSSFTYPQVKPEVMASVNELLNKDFTVQEIIDRIVTSLSDLAKEPLMTSLIEDERPIFYRRLQQMERRNDMIRSIIKR